MSFFSEFSEGLGAYSRAHKAIRKYRLSKYFIIPGIITIGFAIAYIALFGFIGSQIEVDADSLPSWLSWVGSAANWLIRAALWLASIWFFLATYKFVVMTILSPYLSSLSEALEAHIRGRKPVPINFKDYVNDMIRSFRLNLRNIIREFFLGLLANFIPVVGPIVVFGISAYYYGFGYVDYILERKRFNIRKSVRFMRKRTGLAVGLGTPAVLLMFVPVLGWMIAPVYATAAATIQTMDELEELSHVNAVQA